MNHAALDAPRRSRRLARLTLLVAAVLSAPAIADVDVCYFGGPNLPNFRLNGNARLDGTALVVTESLSTQRSSTAYNVPLSTSGNISIQMRVRISQNSGGGADGIAFVMHNDASGVAALGLAGEGIGYQGINSSVIVEFDTYRNTNRGDPNDSHVAVQLNGDPTHGGASQVALVSSPGVTLKDGTPINVWIDYVGVSHNLRVYLSTSATRPTTAIVDATVDVPAVVGAQMYLAFTGSTGGAWSKHEVLELFASDHGAAGAACCASDATCASSAAGRVCDPVKRLCGPCTLGETSQCLATEQACDVAASINECVVPCTGDLGSGGAHPCTAAAFPVCSASGASTGSCVACDADYGQAGRACPQGAPTCLANGYCGLCTSNYDCEGSGHVGNVCTTSTGLCGTCSSSAQCLGSSTCTAGRCVCAVDADCGSLAFCEGGSCLPQRPAGQPLPGTRTCPDSAPAVCTTDRCNETAATCAAPGGAPCTQPAQCTANLCGADSQCGCVVDADCHPTQHCAYASRTCEGDLASGTPIPDDGLHGGSCSDAAQVCQSGLCNAVTVTCAALDASECTSGAACVSDTCASGHCVPAASGCWLDADCPATSYCGRATLTCATDLGPGAGIPSDGLHGGTCADATAVCASGLCNAATSTCATASGGTCSAANQCVSNTCTSGHCVPATNGCWLDADCAGTSYCDRATLTCAADLAVGAAIPSDGLHGGTCSDATTVCATGLCNASTSTCAGTGGASCTLAAECVSDVCRSGHCVAASDGCWLDADCPGPSHCDRAALGCVADLPAGAGLPTDGLHGGTCVDAPAVCVSGLCNATTSTCATASGGTCSAANQCVSNTCTSAHCVPATSGCWLDADCPATSYCDRATLTCSEDLVAGAAIPSDGLHDGTCSAGSGAAVCVTGLCNDTTDTCASASGATCTAAGECVANACTGGRCVAASDGCYLDADCPATSYCDRAAFTCATDLPAGQRIPDDGLHDGTCSEANRGAVCVTGRCNATSSTCAAVQGSTCAAASDCESNTCTSGHCVPATDGCYADADCPSTSYCDRATLACTADLAAGASIPNDGLHDGTCNGATAAAVCLSGACNPSSKTCGSRDGATCATVQDCASNACASERCVPNTGGCFTDADCGAAAWCERRVLTCRARLGPGAAIPQDGLHDGVCSASSAVVCASGTCNATTHTCGQAVGASCTSASECVSNTCTSGICVPASNGCARNEDCGGTAYCDGSAHTCVPKLEVGAAVPDDGIQAGACTELTGPAVCATGLCNPATNTCAKADDQTCTADAECAGNSCVAGQCGGTVLFRGGGCVVAERGAGDGTAAWLFGALVGLAGLARHRRGRRGR